MSRGWRVLCSERSRAQIPQGSQWSGSWSSSSSSRRDVRWCSALFGCLPRQVGPGRREIVAAVESGRETRDGGPKASARGLVVRERGEAGGPRDEGAGPGGESSRVAFFYSRAGSSLGRISRGKVLREVRRTSMGGRARLRNVMAGVQQPSEVAVGLEWVAGLASRGSLKSVTVCQFGDGSSKLTLGTVV
jgi:hypothetical protein